MSGEEVADGEVVKLFPVICLKSMYGAAKLCSDVRVKGDKGSWNIGFLM